MTLFHHFGKAGRGQVKDIVIYIAVFLVLNLRNTDETVIQGANSGTLLGILVLTQ
jgi:hypothetical protein